MSEPKKTISRSEYLQTVGLLTIASEHLKAMKDIEQALAEVLGAEGDETEYYGHVSDAIYQPYSAKELLATMKIKVRR